MEAEELRRLKERKGTDIFEDPFNLRKEGIINDVVSFVNQGNISQANLILKKEIDYSKNLKQEYLEDVKKMNDRMEGVTERAGSEVGTYTVRVTQDEVYEVKTQQMYLAEHVKFLNNVRNVIKAARTAQPPAEKKGLLEGIRKVLVPPGKTVPKQIAEQPGKSFICSKCENPLTYRESVEENGERKDIYVCNYCN